MELHTAAAFQQRVLVRFGVVITMVGQRFNTRSVAALFVEVLPRVRSGFQRPAQTPSNMGAQLELPM
jgi:hypothetical protein